MMSPHEKTRTARNTPARPNTPKKRKYTPRRTSGWNDERRARHAAAMKKWKPWKKSTGPRTTPGKKITSQNAFKHGNRSAAFNQNRAENMKPRRFMAMNERFTHFINLYIQIKKSGCDEQTIEMLDDCARAWVQTFATFYAEWLYPEAIIRSPASDTSTRTTQDGCFSTPHPLRTRYGSCHRTMKTPAPGGTHNHKPYAGYNFWQRPPRHRETRSRLRQGFGLPPPSS